MSESKTALTSLIDSLKRERDELKLKAHLAGMDAKDEYDRLSTKIDELTARYEPLTDAVGESADNVFAALRLAGEEMIHGFHRIRKSIGSDETSD